LRLTAAALPLLDGAYELVGRNKTGGMKTNREYFSPWVRIAAGVDPVIVDLGYDPQTSGGLLISVAAAEADRLAAALERNGVAAARIGEAVPAGAERMVLEA
jgi:selenide,water dikinase